MLQLGQPRGVSGHQLLELLDDVVRGAVGRRLGRRLVGGEALDRCVADFLDQRVVGRLAALAQVGLPEGDRGVDHGLHPGGARGALLRGGRNRIPGADLGAGPEGHHVDDVEIGRGHDAVDVRSQHPGALEAGLVLGLGGGAVHRALLHVLAQLGDELVDGVDVAQGHGVVVEALQLDPLADGLLDDADVLFGNRHFRNDAQVGDGLALIRLLGLVDGHFLFFGFLTQGYTGHPEHQGADDGYTDESRHDVPPVL